jgi:hypothetical protein
MGYIRLEGESRALKHIYQIKTRSHIFKDNHTKQNDRRKKKSGIISKTYNGVEVYQCCCNMNKRNGLARFQLGLWKLIHVRRDGEKERCHCVMK